MQKREMDKDIDKLLEEAIDHGLNVIGTSGKQMLFFHLERDYSMKKSEITRKPEVFAVAVQKIFGAGAPVLEKLILKNVCSKLGLEYQEKKQYKFSDYLKALALALEQEMSKDSIKKGELNESIESVC